MKWHDQAELTIHSRLCAVLRMGPHDVRYLREDRTLTNCFVADLYNVTCSSGCSTWTAHKQDASTAIWPSDC